MNLSKYDIEALINTWFNRLSSMPMQIPAAPVLTPPPDLNPIADAIRDGLSAIANAIEYGVQLEDARERERNQ